MTIEKLFNYVFRGFEDLLGTEKKMEKDTNPNLKLTAYWDETNDGGELPPADWRREEGEED